MIQIYFDIDVESKRLSSDFLFRQNTAEEKQFEVSYLNLVGHEGEPDSAAISATMR